MSLIAKISIGIGFFIAGIFAVIYINAAILNSTAEVRGATEENEEIVADGTFRNNTEQEFYMLCNTVKTQQQQIEADQQAIDNPDTPEETKKLIADGIIAKRNTMISTANKYNAKAADVENKGQFRNAELPSQIDPNQEVSCGE